MQQVTDGSIKAKITDDVIFYLNRKLDISTSLEIYSPVPIVNQSKNNSSNIYQGTLYKQQNDLSVPKDKQLSKHSKLQ